MLRAISTTALDDEFSELAPYIKRFLDKNPLKHSLAAVYAAIAEEKLKLFALEDSSGIAGAGILHLGEELGKKILTVWGLSYKLGYQDYFKDMAAVEAIALAYGADYISYNGRPGFAKRNRNSGWKTVQVVMVKEVL